jgi:hypothetical protein
MINLSSNTSFDSDTATLPHPVNMTITTPQTSLARGDWGFKRPLPLRSTTKSSTPLIRVDAIDSYEQVTDYSSAADHTITLRKFEEMGVTMSTPPQKARTALGYTEPVRKGPRSVFESSIDSTVLKEGSDESRDKRWRFSGPWIAGLTDGDFNSYITKQVRRRRVEFTKYLQIACAENATKDARRVARNEGVEAPEPVQVSDITEEHFRKYLKALRQDRIELYRHIRKFLDLPPSPNVTGQGSTDWLASIFDGGKASVDGKDLQPTSDSPYADSGPPKTHPSAGLGYGISSAHTFNHPLYGPQNKKAPVQARVVMPRGAAAGNFAPVLGVGGFVVDLPTGAGATSYNVRGAPGRGPEGPIPGLINIEPNKVGGSKAYVHPTSASVDPKGRVVLKVEQADPEAVAVLEGKVDEIPKRQIMRTKGLGLSSSSLSRSSGGYGLSFRGSSEQNK